MRIGIDCRFWGIKHAGLGRYTHNLATNLLRIDQENKYILFFRKEKGKGIKHLSNVEKVFFDVPHYSLKEQALFPRTIAKYKLDLLHFPHFNIPIFLRKTPFIVTIHDLIKHFFKGRTVTTKNILTHSIKHLGYQLVIDKAIKKAQKIIVPSYFVKDQISVHYPGSKEKIKVIYEGVDEKLKTQSPKSKAKRILKKYRITKPYFLYVGNVYPFKNVPMLLKTFKRESNPKNPLKKVSLVIVCSRSVFWQRLKKQVKQLGLRKRVIMTGRISDKELRVLYKNAIAFTTPSLMEGFGLPGLEALSIGCPVIAAKAGSLPEIYGDAATYFDPQNTDDLVKKMNKVLSFAKDQRKKIIQKGKDQAQKYSWRKMAEETLEIYRQSFGQT